MLVMPSPKSRMKCPRVRLAPVLRGGTTPRGGLAGGSRSATRRGRGSWDFMGKRALWGKRGTRTLYDRRPLSDMWRGESEVGTAAGRPGVHTSSAITDEKEFSCR